MTKAEVRRWAKYLIGRRIQADMDAGYFQEEDPKIQTAIEEIAKDFVQQDLPAEQ